MYNKINKNNKKFGIVAEIGYLRRTVNPVPLWECRFDSDILHHVYIKERMYIK